MPLEALELDKIEMKMLHKSVNKMNCLYPNDGIPIFCWLLCCLSNVGCFVMSVKGVSLLMFVIVLITLFWPAFICRLFPFVLVPSFLFLALFCIVSIRLSLGSKFSSCFAIIANWVLRCEKGYREEHRFVESTFEVFFSLYCETKDSTFPDKLSSRSHSFVLWLMTNSRENKMKAIRSF